MTSRLISSLAGCSIPRVSFISRSQSQFYSTTPLISTALILRNLISKPCCAISVKSASSTSLASENDKIKPADENLLRVLESELAEKELKNVLPKDFQFEIIDNPGNKLIALKREYDSEQIQATLSRDYESGISLSVTIDKKVGPTLSFWCNLTPNDFKIRSMTLKSSENFYKDNSEGPDFCDMGERLQSAFQKYLVARGFEINLYDYLHYLVDRKHFAWQSLKEFIEK